MKDGFPLELNTCPADPDSASNAHPRVQCTAKVVGPRVEWRIEKDTNNRKDKSMDWLAEAQQLICRALEWFHTIAKEEEKEAAQGTISSILRNLSAGAGGEGVFSFQLKLLENAPLAVAWHKTEQEGFSIQLASPVFACLMKEAGPEKETDKNALVYLLSLAFQHTLGSMAGMTALESNLAMVSILKVVVPHILSESIPLIDSCIIFFLFLSSFCFFFSLSPFWQQNSVQGSIITLLASNQNLDPRGLLAAFVRHAPQEENALEQARWATWLVGQHRKRMSYDFIRGEVRSCVLCHCV